MATKRYYEAIAILVAVGLMHVGAAASPGWPFITIRQTGGVTRKGDMFREIIAVNARHPGSVDEYWLAFQAGRPVNEFTAELSRYEPFLPLLKDAHIAVGSQQGVTLGHHRFNASPGLFTDDAWQINRHGQRLMALCPRSPEVLAYEEALVESAVRTLGLDSVWLDDDLRMVHGKPEDGEGCFCGRCMEAFNAEYGLSLARGELVARLDSKEPKEELRRSWRLFKNKTLAVYAAAARRGADRVSPDVRLGYQSVDSFLLPAGEDYLPVLRELAGSRGGKSAIRVGSGHYFESLSGSYAKAFSVMREAERCRRADFVAQVSYEQETYTREILHKSAEAVLIESAMALAAGADALTEYWWSADREEPASYYEEFATMLVEWRQYLETLAAVSRNTSIGGLARFRGADYLTLDGISFFDGDDTAFGSIGIPMSVADSPHVVWYFNERSLREWGPGDAERLAAKGAVVDKAVWDRLLSRGGKEVARGVQDGRIVPFDLALVRRRNNTLPTHAERLALLDVVDRIKPLPVRIERAHPLYVFPRIDSSGHVRAVSLFNGSIGRCLPTAVVVRRPSCEEVRLLRPGEPARPLQADRDGDSLIVTVPGIPGGGTATLLLAGEQST